MEWKVCSVPSWPRMEEHNQKTASPTRLNGQLCLQLMLVLAIQQFRRGCRVSLLSLGETSLHQARSNGIWPGTQDCSMIKAK